MRLLNHDGLLLPALSGYRRSMSDSGIRLSIRVPITLIASRSWLRLLPVADEEVEAEVEDEAYIPIIVLVVIFPGISMIISVLHRQPVPARPVPEALELVRPFRQCRRSHLDSDPHRISFPEPSTRNFSRHSQMLEHIFWDISPILLS